MNIDYGMVPSKKSQYAQLRKKFLWASEVFWDISGLRLDEIMSQMFPQGKCLLLLHASTYKIIRDIKWFLDTKHFVDNNYSIEVTPKFHSIA
jgi:hypothetical protein